MRLSAVLAVSALGTTMCCAALANASTVMTIEQVGSDVVATASGSIDTTDLTFLGSVPGGGVVLPDVSVLYMGSAGSTDVYGGSISGPSSFGTGFGEFASSSSGDDLAIDDYDTEIGVPTGYVSGTALFGTATWDSTTLSTLGITPGTYTWTWGSGADADSLTLNALAPAPAATPEPAPATLLALGLIVALLTARKQLRG